MHQCRESGQVRSGGSSLVPAAQGECPRRDRPAGRLDTPDCSGEVHGFVAPVGRTKSTTHRGERTTCSLADPPVDIADKLNELATPRSSVVRIETLEVIPVSVPYVRPEVTSFARFSAASSVVV